MVQLMKNSNNSPELQKHEKMTPVKREITEEHTQYDQQQERINKRPRHQEIGIGNFPVSPAQYNPLDEPSPLGLRLRKSPSLLELIQMKLSEGSAASKLGSDSKRGNKNTTASAATDKLKASNFPASLLKIGTWEV
ncbi:hypothetical protein M8C21_011190, partial [Ambrosia artemisiifolia]